MPDLEKYMVKFNQIINSGEQRADTAGSPKKAEKSAAGVAKGGGKAEGK